MQYNPGEAENESPDMGIQVLVIILSCIFGVPFIILLFFSILSIIRMCRNNSETTAARPFAFIRRRTPPEPAPEIINLEEYKIDEIGPFMINPREQCSICLD